MFINITSRISRFILHNSPICNKFIKCLLQNLEQRRGLKIEERLLTHSERYKLWFANNYETGMEYNEDIVPYFDDDYYKPTPTKLITITYKNEKIENYE